MRNSDYRPIRVDIFAVEPIKEDVPIAEPVENDIIIKLPLEEVVKDFFRDYVVVWHDPNSNPEENHLHKAQLEKFCQVLTFTEWEKAKDYIETTQAACHVITAGTNGELFVKEISEEKNVSNIYVFCEDKNYHSTWTERYWKVVCVETCIETVLNQVKKNLVEWLKEEGALKLNLPAFAPIFNDSDKSEMNHLHLYLKVIPNFKNRAQAKEDFVSLSKRIYSKQGDMKNLEEFEKSYNDYNKDQTLKWYTRESFFYKMANKCLRIATSDSIQYCRLLLKDIERAIREQYQMKTKDFNGLLYRGAYMSEGEWSSLKENTGREIEMHGFLSVSKVKGIALNFMKADPSKMALITIIVPKGPNEEEQGFAEIQEYSMYPMEKEVLFNVRSRFTVLEAEDDYDYEYAENAKCRHLVLLYGARGFRKFITEEKPNEIVSIRDVLNLSCSHCKEKITGMSFIPIADAKKEIYYCKKCLDYDAAPFLCVPPTGKEQAYETNIRGCLLMNANQKQTPFYGYKCCNCQAKKQKAYFFCADCCESHEKWCESCFEKTPKCIESGHRVILETSPFSFWCESMSQNELNHMKFQNDLVESNNNLFQQAEMYSESHQYEKAVEYYRLYIQENKENDKDINLAISYNNIGRTYNEQGEYEKALEYFLKSLHTYRAVYGGDNHPDVATCFHNIGWAHDKQGEHKEALGHYFKSLDIYKAVYGGDNHPQVATSYNNIGLVYHNQREDKKALEHFLKSLNIRKSVYGGDNHPEVGASYDNIGSVYYNQGDYKKALEHNFKSLDIRKSIYGDIHPEVAACYNNIGNVYYNQGEHRKALEHYFKSLEIRKSVYGGDNHPAIAISYNNIGNMYHNQGEYKKALEHHFKSLDVYKSVYGGDNHPEIATSYNNIGAIYKIQGEYEKALEYYLKSLEIRKSVYGGDNHPTIAISYNNIGMVYKNQGEDKKALEHFLKSLEIYKSVYGGDNHPEIAISYNNIGMVYDDQGEYEKALEYYFKSLEIYKSVYGGDNHPSIATSESNIGTSYYDQGEYEKALEHYLKSLDIYTSLYGENHPKTIAIQNRIHEILSFD